MARDKKQQSVTIRIAELKDAIRQKYQKFKLGIVETEQLLEKQYKPLITELKNAERVKRNTEERVKRNTDEELNDSIKADDFKPKQASSPKKQSVTFIADGDLYGDEPPSLSQVMQSPSALKEASEYVLETFSAPLTQKYMLKLMKGEVGATNKIDNIYGPRIDNDKLMVGNSPLTFDEDGNIILNKVQYKGTEGLYELLFKRQPDDSVYNRDDLNAYKDMLIKSSAHKKNYVSNNHINRPVNSIKYKTIVSTLFPKDVYGKGFKHARSRDIFYWNDPNELCARLKLLVGSTEVGNTAHKNEIQNIIEELREAKLVSGSGNSRYKALTH